MTTYTSTRLAHLVASPIRDILAVVDQPGMISYAGGLPAAQTFPAIDVGSVPPRFLQYGPTEGEPELRARVAEEVTRRGLRCNPDQVLILSGSQQGLDLVAKLCIDEGSVVALESPTYLAALQVFRFFGAQFVALNAGALPADTRMVYTCPTFQNPTGTCYSRQQREDLARACDRAGTVLIEDDPYYDLAYEDCERTPVCAFRSEGSWVYQGSFSKTFAPGLRLGYLVASPELVAPLTHLKQAADLHSNRVAQYLVLQMLDAPDYRQRLSGLANTYKHKRDRFATQLHESLAPFANWRSPPGGLFFWLELTGQLRLATDELLKLAIERGVAFMPGEPFWIEDKPPQTAIRLNFSFAAEMHNATGLSVLAQLLEEQQVT